MSKVVGMLTAIQLVIHFQEYIYLFVKRRHLSKPNGPNQVKLRIFNIVKWEAFYYSIISFYCIFLVLKRIKKYNKEQKDSKNDVKINLSIPKIILLLFYIFTHISGYKSLNKIENNKNLVTAVNDATDFKSSVMELVSILCLQNPKANAKSIIIAICFYDFVEILMLCQILRYSMTL